MSGSTQDRKLRQIQISLCQGLASAKVILGPPGCGKTYTLIEIIKDALDRGISPESIGFVSFTKKAVTEASERAGKAFNLTYREMPYFKTLHAMGFMMLGMQRQDVMSGADWKAFAQELGTEINGPNEHLLDDGTFLPMSMAEGDKYLRVIERAKMRCVSLEEEYNGLGNHQLSWGMLNRFNQLLEVYKSQLGKCTFVDMIDRFVEFGEAPRLRMLIVDEAQDLNALQWLMVLKLAERTDEVYIAGDDDQAIHGWAGASHTLFNLIAQDPRILNQSYRLPRSVFEVSQQIVHRIVNRIPKEYSPLDEDGSVSFYPHWQYLDFSQGSWSFMTRTNSMVSRVAKAMREEGYLYSLKGRPSVNENVAASIRAWDHLRQGGTVDLRTVKTLFQQMPKQGSRATLKRGGLKLLETADPVSMFSLPELQLHYGVLATENTHAFDVLNLGYDDRVYIDALLRRGEKIWETPRIKLSTIHAMKGGEDENVALYLGSNKSCAESENQADEHRVFYVGATRARHNLHLIEGSERFNYDL